MLLLILISVAAQSQDYAFKVLINKGKNEVKNGNNWELVKVGASLKSADEIRTAENSYLGLIHVSGKPLELKQPGKYKVIELAGKVSGGASVLNKYTDFILSANETKVNHLEATGAVHRGPNSIHVYLPKPEMALVYNHLVIINWENKTANKVAVSFSSVFGDSLKTVTTTQQAISIDLNDNSFANEDNIIVKVTRDDDRQYASDEYTLKKLSKADKARIKSLLTEINTQTADDNALNKLVLAGFFEQNNLLIDAGTAYQQAIQLAPDVSAYAEAYEKFLQRHGLAAKERE